MRHDAHYVEELSHDQPKPVGRLIAIDKIDPNPEQPRLEIGDLSNLTMSIKEKGVLEPLLVKPVGQQGRWMIIAGERRWRAASAAGLRELPCVEMNVDESEVAEIALIENLQRKDLTPWEESDGLVSLCERYGYTHEEVARRVGKSRSTITESLSIATLPEDIRDQCRRADISAKSILLEIVRQPDKKAMSEMAKKIIEMGMKRDAVRLARSSRRKRSKRKGFMYSYVAPDREFKLEITFPHQDVSRLDIVTALKLITKKLERDSSYGDASDNV
jgi:ParB family chromosome partitioning protein